MSNGRLGKRGQEYLLRARAIAINEWASRRLRNAYPAIAGFAIGTALLLGLLNLSLAVGQRNGALNALGRHVRVATWAGPAALPFLLGVFMIVLAYQLWLRKRVALILLCGFIAGQAVSDVLRGMSPVDGVLLVMIPMLLLLSRSEFPARPNPDSYSRLKVAAPVLAAVYIAYGIIGLYLMRSSVGLEGASVYALAYRSVQVAAGGSGLVFHGGTLVYSYSLTLFALAVLIIVCVSLFRPYRDPVDQDRALCSRARELVGRYGADSVAYFNLRADKKHFFHTDEMFIAYKVAGNVAVISGDPVGPHEFLGETLVAFKAYCRERGWRTGAMVASGDLLPYYEEAGFKGFSLGEVAIIDLDGFTPEGRDVRKLRQGVRKIEKAGITVEFMFNSGIPAHMRHELAGISDDWRCGKAETGFSMGLGRLLGAEDPDCLLSIAYDREMNPLGFIYWVPMNPHLGYSLDIHCTRIDAPGALSEFIIARTAEFLHQNGYSCLSLHFLAFSERYREDREREGSGFWRWVASVADHVFPVVSVYRFDKKFCPTWKKRLLLYQGAADLLLLGRAIISAEPALKVTRPKDRKKRQSCS